MNGSMVLRSSLLRGPPKPLGETLEADRPRSPGSNRRERRMFPPTRGTRRGVLGGSARRGSRAVPGTAVFSALTRSGCGKVEYSARQGCAIDGGILLRPLYSREVGQGVSLDLGAALVLEPVRVRACVFTFAHLSRSYSPCCATAPAGAFIAAPGP